MTLRLINDNVIVRRLDVQERRKYDGEPETMLIAVELPRARGQAIKTDHWGEVLNAPIGAGFTVGDVVAFDAMYSGESDKLEYEGKAAEVVKLEHVLCVWEA